MKRTIAILLFIPVLFISACKEKAQKGPESMFMDNTTTSHPAIITEEYIYEIKDALSPDGHARRWVPRFFRFCEGKTN